MFQVWLIIVNVSELLMACSQVLPVSGVRLMNSDEVKNESILVILYECSNDQDVLLSWRLEKWRIFLQSQSSFLLNKKVGSIF